MKKTHLLAGGVAVLAVGVTAILMATTRPSRDVTSDVAGAGPVPVQVVRATVQDLGDWFEVGGDVRARETATLVSRIVAPIVRVLVQPGQTVTTGQPLVVLDARDLDAARTRAQAGITAADEAANAAAAERQAAEAALVLAEATYKRIAELRAKNSATPNELDEALAGLHAAQARLKGAEALIARAAAGIAEARAASEASIVARSYATITAPFDGVVTQKLVDPGNMASPGVPLVTIEDARAFRLEVRIDESRASLVRLGQDVDVSLDPPSPPDAPSPGAWRTGRVAEIAHVLDQTAHAFVAKIDLPRVDGLRSGMFGRARFAGASRRVLAVPAATIVRRGQLTSVYVVDRSGVARLRLVSLGEAAAGMVEVRAGLDAGETIVVQPGPGLVDGNRVTPRASSTSDSAPGGRA